MDPFRPLLSQDLLMGSTGQANLQPTATRQVLGREIDSLRIGTSPQTAVLKKAADRSKQGTITMPAAKRFFPPISAFATTLRG